VSSTGISGAGSPPPPPPPPQAASVKAADQAMQRHPKHPCIDAMPHLLPAAIGPD
jgi:hypothetical protein